MCNCVTRLNELLAPHNYALSRNLLEGDTAPALVEIYKKDRKKRTASMSCVATFCPFCGEKYQERSSRGVVKASLDNTSNRRSRAVPRPNGGTT